MRLARRCGVNVHLKMPCLVAGMIGGADSIYDMDLLRHGAMPDLFGGIRAPSTLGRSCDRSPGGTCCSWEGQPAAAGGAGPPVPLLPRGGCAGVR